MDLQAILNDALSQAIGGRRSRRGGLLERMLRGMIWAKVDNLMADAFQSVKAEAKSGRRSSKTQAETAAAMETAVPEPVAIPAAATPTSADPAAETPEAPRRRNRRAFDPEIERIQVEVIAALEAMQPTLDRTQEEFDADKPFILRTIIDTLLEAQNLSAKDLRRLNDPAELIAAADSGRVREQPHFAAYMLGDNATARMKERLTNVNFDREGEGYENVRLPSFAFGQDVPTAPWDQPAPAVQPQPQSVAKQALNQAAAPDDSDQWQQEMQRIQADVATALAAMDKPDDRDDATWQHDLENIPRAIEAGLQHERGYGLTADDLNRFTAAPLVQAAIPEVNHGPTFNVSKLPPDLIATLKDARAAKQQRESEPQQPVNVTPQPAAATQQPQPRGQSSQQRGTAAEQAMEDAARATAENADATQELHRPLVALKLAILSMLGFNRNNGATAAGGGMRGGGNNNQPPAAPPPDNNQGDNNQGGSNRPFRRPSMFQRIMRRGPRRAVTRAGAMLGGGVARLAGGNAMAGAAAGASIAAAGASIAALANPITAVVVAVGLAAMGLYRFAKAATDATSRVSRWSAQITGAEAMRDMNRQFREMRFAADVQEGGAAAIKEADRFEKNLLPIQTALTQFGNFFIEKFLGAGNVFLENVTLPMLERMVEGVETLGGILDAVRSLPEWQRTWFLTDEQMKDMEEEKRAHRLAAEAAERRKEMQDRIKQIAPQMNNINAMMNDLAAGRRPF